MNGNDLRTLAAQVVKQPVPEWVVQSELLPVPDNPSGLGFFRRNDNFIHLNDSGEFTTISTHVKILSPQALNVGNVAITWSPDAGGAQVHALNIHRNGQVTDVLATNEFETLRRESQLEYAVLDGVLTAVLQVPDLRVGDELEFSYTVPTHDPTLGQKAFGLIVLGGLAGEGLHSAGISWMDRDKPEIQITQDLSNLAVQEDNRVYVLLENPEISGPPPDAPPRYDWQNVIEYSDFESWQDVSARMNTLYSEDGEISKSSDIMTEVKLISETYDDELSRAGAALKLVQNQVRYIYVGLEGGNYKTVNAQDTWSRRYGDCKGKSVLLLSMLRELGIEAELVLANNTGVDATFADRLPSPALFNHMLVRANIDGLGFWLDGTLPGVISPSRNPFMPYRYVLPLSDRGGDLEPVEPMRFFHPQTMGLMEIDARLGFEKPARFVKTNVTRGIQGASDHLQFSSLTKSQLETGFRKMYVDNGDWEDLESVEYRYDLDTGAAILTIKGTGFPDWEKESSGRYTLALPGGGFRPPQEKSRSKGEQSEMPFYTKPDYSCHATTVRLPENTKTENWGYNTTFAQNFFGRLYYRMVERRNDGTIRMVRGSRVLEPEITVDRAAEDNLRVEDFDNSMATIEYDSSRIFKPYGQMHDVPATFDFDWIRFGGHCSPELIFSGEHSEN